MPDIAVVCPHCVANARLDAELAGKFTSCPRCGRQFLVANPAQLRRAAAARGLRSAMKIGGALALALIAALSLRPSTRRAVRHRAASLTRRIAGSARAAVRR